uniref:Tf2-1-like SH3-like domain-containing protein n=1 Tax=Ananas comosus var. bracteatus TaxID=296719 RepID=A0A6V7NHK1_ANACO|nr:unnamed protein product [Ananas comosus var. bracteatus]
MPVYLLALRKLGNFDVVLGMNWLTKYYATINCKNRMVTFREPGQTEVMFRGCQSLLFAMSISLSRARQLISRGCVAYLASIVLRDEDDTPRIEDIPIVREFSGRVSSGATGYQASIKMAPFEALYGRKCRSLLHWSEVGERLALGPDVLQELRTRSRRLEGSKRFGIWGKLSPRFIGLYEILERVGPVVYRLALSPNLSSVHNVFHVSVLRKYVFDPTHVLDATPVELRDDLRFEEQPVKILAHEMKNCGIGTFRM